MRSPNHNFVRLSQRPDVTHIQCSGCHSMVPAKSALVDLKGVAYNAYHPKCAARLVEEDVYYNTPPSEDEFPQLEEEERWPEIRAFETGIVSLLEPNEEDFDA